MHYAFVQPSRSDADIIRRGREGSNHNQESLLCVGRRERHYGREGRIWFLERLQVDSRPDFKSLPQPLAFRIFEAIAIAKIKARASSCRCHLSRLFAGEPRILFSSVSPHTGQNSPSMEDAGWSLSLSFNERSFTDRIQAGSTQGLMYVLQLLAVLPLTICAVVGLESHLLKKVIETGTTMVFKDRVELLIVALYRKWKREQM